MQKQGDDDDLLTETDRENVSAAFLGKGFWGKLIQRIISFFKYLGLGLGVEVGFFISFAIVYLISFLLGNFMLSSREDSPLLCQTDFPDLSAIVQRVEHQSDKTSIFLWGRFTLQVKQIMLLPDTSDTRYLKEFALVSELNRLIREGNIYNKENFPRISNDEARNLLKSNPSGDDLARLNRLLLEQAYPELPKLGPPPSNLPKYAEKLFEPIAVGAMVITIFLAALKWKKIKSDDDLLKADMAHKEQLANEILQREAGRANSYQHEFNEFRKTLQDWTPPRFTTQRTSLSKNLRKKYRLPVRFEHNSPPSQCLETFKTGSHWQSPSAPLRPLLDLFLPDGSPSDNDVSRVPLDTIADQFRKEEAASDFHCVILATPTSDFVLTRQNWLERCKYFAGFYREPWQKRHLITRVFSVPACIQNDTDLVAILEPKVSMGTAKDGKSLSCSQGALLFVQLLINELCGVDARLHLFQCRTNEVESNLNDFFEGADYVLMRRIYPDSESSGPSVHSFLWVYDQRNSSGGEQVFQLDHPYLLSVFDDEFYRRLTPRKNKDTSQGVDRLLQISRNTLREVCEHLNVSHQDIETLRKIIHEEENFCKIGRGAREPKFWRLDLEDWLSVASAELIKQWPPK